MCVLVSTMANVALNGQHKVILCRVMMRWKRSHVIMMMIKRFSNGIILCRPYSKAKWLKCLPKDKKVVSSNVTQDL